MKLRNKKTGEIGTLSSSAGTKYMILDENGVALSGYMYLKDLCLEWHDYEEPAKPYWFINDLDGKPMKCDLKNCGKSNFIKWGGHRKQIDNYFETREEAEKAVEKLKAWKRLKDKGFEFDYVDEYENLCGNGFEIPVRGIMPAESYRDKSVLEDLQFLFGGEE